MSKDTTTAVDEKDLPAIPEPTYENAPETLEDAIERLLKVEMLLEDLSRAVEIASITRQLDMLDSFKQTADDYLAGKVQIVQPDMGEFKVTVITDEEVEDNAKTS